MSYKTFSDRVAEDERREYAVSKLVYRRPALQWITGMPMGNGTLGAMLYGKPGSEVLTLNHDRLWRNNIDETKIKTASIIPTMREY